MLEGSKATKYFVYVTTANIAEAKMIGKELVSERLAACVNIIDGMESIYRWEGKICDGVETILIAKSTSACVTELIEKVKALHSYTCPCIVALPIAAGNPGFLDWLDRETGGVIS